MSEQSVGAVRTAKRIGKIFFKTGFSPPPFPAPISSTHSHSWLVRPAGGGARYRNFPSVECLSALPRAIWVSLSSLCSIGTTHFVIKTPLLMSEQSAGEVRAAKRIGKIIFKMEFSVRPSLSPTHSAAPQCTQRPRRLQSAPQRLHSSSGSSSGLSTRLRMVQGVSRASLDRNSQPANADTLQGIDARRSRGGTGPPGLPNPGFPLTSQVLPG